MPSTKGLPENRDVRTSIFSSSLALLLTWLALLCVLLAATPASAQTHVFTFRGHKSGSFGERLGHALAGIGDIDRDGHADFILGAPRCGAVFEGRVYVVSGSSGKIVRTIDGGESGAEFGSSVDGCEDVNGDGYPDYIIGSPCEYGELGEALVVSGKTGGVIFSVFRDHPCGVPGKKCNIGNSVARAGDVDNDGKPDVIIGAPGTNSGTTYGFVLVYALHPKTKLLYKLDGTKTFPMGSSVASAGDVDKDGHADFIVVGSSVRICSGKTGKVLRDVKGDGAMGLGDLDGDEYADYAVWNSGGTTIYSGQKHTVIRAVSSGGAAVAAGRIDADTVPDYLVKFGADKVNAYSGKTGKLLAVVPGTTLGSVGDVNGDGRSDILVGDPSKDSGKGLASVWSVAAMPLWTNHHGLSIPGRDTQTFHLEAGAANAGKSYWIVGSASGTAPGIPLGGHRLPLNPDIYTQCTLFNPTFITGGAGQLSAIGEASASLRVPIASSSSLVGLVVHHAYVVFSLPLQFHLASNAVPLVLVK